MAKDDTPLRRFSRLINSPGMQAVSKAARDMMERVKPALPSPDVMQTVSHLARALGEAPDPGADQPVAPPARATPPATPEALLIAEQRRREAAGHKLLGYREAWRWLRARGHSWEVSKQAQTAAWKTLGLKAGRRNAHNNAHKTHANAHKESTQKTK